METLDIRTGHVAVPNGDTLIAAYVAKPLGEGPFPGIVVLQEIFGINPHIREVTERLAREGYIAIAPALFQRQHPGFEAGYADEDIQAGRKLKDQTKADELLADLRAAVQYLNHLPGLEHGSLGCIGFCFGGHVAFLAATLPDFKATASFYGAGLPTWTPGGGPPTLSLARNIKGIIHLFFGTRDPSIPPQAVEEIERELTNRDVPHAVHRFDAAHGFFCDQRASFDSLSAARAWEVVKNLFACELKGQRE